MLTADIYERVDLKCSQLVDSHYEASGASKGDDIKIILNRSNALKPYKARLFGGAVPLAVVLGFYVLYLTLAGMEGMLSQWKTATLILTLITLFFAGIYIIFSIMPFRRAVKSTPRTIMILSDKLEIDGERLYYKDMRGLKLTSPYVSTEKIVRELIIQDRTGTFRFTLGSNSKEYSAIWEGEYLLLYEKLHPLISEEPKPRKIFWFIS